MSRMVLVSTPNGARSSFGEILRKTFMKMGGSMYESYLRDHNTGDGRKFWVVLNPMSEKPITKKFYTFEKAQEVAKIMASRNPGEEFIVMASCTSFRKNDFQQFDYQDFPPF